MAHYYTLAKGPDVDVPDADLWRVVEKCFGITLSECSIPPGAVSQPVLAVNALGSTRLDLEDLVKPGSVSSAPSKKLLAVILNDHPRSGTKVSKAAAEDGRLRQLVDKQHVVTVPVPPSTDPKNLAKKVTERQVQSVKKSLAQ